MNWEIIGITFGFMIFGYLAGSVINSVWICKFLGIPDVRTKGSGNGGATNVLRVYGVYIGIVVFTLDIARMIWVIVIPWLIMGSSNIFLPAVGIATLIGNIYPIFFGFKGGKGAAAMLGFIVTMSWPLTFVGIISFLALVIKTKKVSIGSIFAPLIIALVYIGFSFIPTYMDEWAHPIFSEYGFWSIWTSFIIIIAIVIFAHRANIKRLINGNESNLSKGKTTKTK